jgi:hypothetical protein
MLTLTLTALTAVATAGEEVVLFDGKDFSAWNHYLDAGGGRGKKKPKKEPKKEPAASAKFEDVWRIEAGAMICTGKPNGFIVTKREFKNYELTLEWRFKPGSKGGNSGVFVHATDEKKIWPKGVEAQLLSGHAGEFWCVGGAKIDGPKDRQDPKSASHYFRAGGDDVEKPIGEWNRYVVRCKDGAVKLTINGKVVNEGKAAEPSSGRILLQSEGAEIHFRNIKLTTLD